MSQLDFSPVRFHTHNELNWNVCLRCILNWHSIISYCSWPKYSKINLQWYEDTQQTSWTFSHEYKFKYRSYKFILWHDWKQVQSKAYYGGLIVFFLLISSSAFILIMLRQKVYGIYFCEWLWLWVLPKIAMSVFII